MDSTLIALWYLSRRRENDKKTDGKGFTKSEYNSVIRKLVKQKIPGAKKFQWYPWLGVTFCVISFSFLMLLSWLIFYTIIDKSLLDYIPNSNIPDSSWRNDSYLYNWMQSDTWIVCLTIAYLLFSNLTLFFMWKIFDNKTWTKAFFYKTYEERYMDQDLQIDNKKYLIFHILISVFYIICSITTVMIYVTGSYLKPMYILSIIFDVLATISIFVMAYYWVHCNYGIYEVQMASIMDWYENIYICPAEEGEEDQKINEE